MYPTIINRYPTTIMTLDKASAIAAEINASEAEYPEGERTIATVEPMPEIERPGGPWAKIKLDDGIGNFLYL